MQCVKQHVSSGSEERCDMPPYIHNQLDIVGYTSPLYKLMVQQDTQLMPPVKKWVGIGGL